MPLSWGDLGSTYVQLVAVLDKLGVRMSLHSPKYQISIGFFNVFGAYLDLILGPLGAILGPSWGHLGAILGPSWAILGPSWGHLGASSGHLGARLGHLGVSWGILSVVSDPWSWVSGFGGRRHGPSGLKIQEFLFRRISMSKNHT